MHQRLQWQNDTDGDSEPAMQQQLLHDNQTFDFTALEKVMEYDAAWGISTCGVERQIGDYRHIFGKYKNSADMQKINDEIECTYIADKDEVMMCTNAPPFVHSGIWHRKNKTGFEV